VIGGLPWQSWLLLVAAGGIGLFIELAFLRNQLRRRRERGRSGDDRNPKPGAGGGGEPR
jgi:hypothetical protein